MPSTLKSSLKSLSVSIKNNLLFSLFFTYHIDTLCVYHRCKLFYKKENEFKEKGVGTLHLKLVSEGKLQLLVRADTNLGKTHSCSNEHRILFLFQHKNDGVETFSLCQKLKTALVHFLFP